MAVRIKNQHYVPRFLLSEFRAREKTGRPQVWCFDKRKGRSFRASVENVCAERSFYDLDTDQGAEQAFAELEGKVSQCHQAVLEARDISALSRDQRVGIAVLIATQHMRTRAFRNTVKEASELAATVINSAKSEEEDRFSPPPDSDFREEDPAKRLQFHLMDRAVPAFAKSLLKMKWVLLLNRTGSPFWCSDNPFTCANPHPYDPNDGLGFERPGSQIHFPLSSEVVLSIVDPCSYFQYPSVLSVNDVQNVVFSNHLQVKNAERFVFSCMDDFGLARDMIADEPGLREPSEVRFNHLDMNRIRR